VHVVKADRQSKGIAPIAPNFSSRQREVVSFMHQLPYLLVKEPWHPLRGLWVEPKSNLNVLLKIKLSCSIGNRTLDYQLIAK